MIFPFRMAPLTSRRPPRKMGSVATITAETVRNSRKKWNPCIFEMGSEVQSAT